MKNFIYSAIVVIIIHLLFFTNIHIKQDVNNIDKGKKSLNHTNIKYVRLSKPKISQATKKIISKKKTPIIKKKVLKKKKYTKKKIVKKIKKYKKVSKHIKKVQKRKQKAVIQKQPKKQLSSLESMFLSKQKNKPIDKITQSYLNLYGNEYNNFTPKQKKYLKENLKDIGRITQKYLFYPRIAARTRQYGTNVVEFYLYPNGDISDLKLIRKLYYTSLDENSIHTIQIAFKDYPRPKTKTKIRIYINYRLR